MGEIPGELVRRKADARQGRTGKYVRHGIFRRARPRSEHFEVDQVIIYISLAHKHILAHHADGVLSLVDIEMLV
jgi:hypothetical protein